MGFYGVYIINKMGKRGVGKGERGVGRKEGEDKH